MLCTCVTRYISKHTHAHTHTGIHSTQITPRSGATQWSQENSAKREMDKIGDFDSPLNPSEMNGFTHTPSSSSDSDPNLDYKPEMSLELEQFDPHYENLPAQRSIITIRNSAALYASTTDSSPASPPPGYDEVQFLPKVSSTWSQYCCIII